MFLYKFLLSLIGFACIGANSNEQSTTLNLIHINDFHSNIEGVNKHTKPCSQKDRDKDKCYGGIAKLVTKVKEVFKSNPNTLFLSAGDNYYGSYWYTLLKYKPILEFMNLLNLTAMSFGNHEFDDTITGLIPFLNKFTSEVVCCNIDVTNEPKMIGKFKKSITTTVKGRKIGIIGYLTNATLKVAKPGNIIFLDVVESIKRQVEELKKENVNIMIAVGHAGFGEDKRIAKEIPEIDIVVGGHSDTFLYNGTPPVFASRKEGTYPIVVEGGKRKTTGLVVQDFRNAIYLGHLTVTFDKDGDYVSHSGNPMYIPSSTPNDPKTDDIIAKYKTNITLALKKVVGYASEDLLAKPSCWEKQCDMGSITADAFLEYFKGLSHPKMEERTLVIVNGGSFVSPISKGKITFENIIGLLPRNGKIGKIQINGSVLCKVFEKSALAIEDGAFLQVSRGVYVNYKITDYLQKNKEKKSAKVERLCVKFNGICETVEDDKIYNVISTDYIIGGGDGYKMLKGAKIITQPSFLDSDVLEQYIAHETPLSAPTDERIRISYDFRMTPKLRNNI